MAVTTPVCDFGWPAPEFELQTIDGRPLRYADIAGPRGTLIVFICNHCPYVRAIENQLARDADDLARLGIGTVAIASNDITAYPQDGPEGMAEQAARAGFSFPYLFDAAQSVAKAYDAVCTPDVYGFDADRKLQYRGRIIQATKAQIVSGARRDLFEAMKQVAETGKGPADQVPSMGCSIKWREDG